jgi:outer membrane protein
MLTTFRAAAAALAFTAVAGAAQAQSPAPIKLGYVNTAALMEVAPGRAAASEQYQKEVVAFQAQQKKWSDSLNKLVGDYQKKEPSLSAEQKKVQEDKITGIQADLEAANLKGQQKIQQRQNELMAPLMELVKNAIDDIRTEGGYSIIFSGDENSPIVSADKNLDLTEKVVARLKTMASKVAPPASSMSGAAVKKPPTR